MARSKQGRRTLGRWLAAGAIAAVVLVVVVAAVVIVRGSPSGAPAKSDARGFPSQVSGLPVLSVAQAADKVNAGEADGQAIAVAGYYNALALPCPAPNRYIGPLERWCDYVAFTDAPGDAQLCTSSANSTSCHQPTATNLGPFFMPESGQPNPWMNSGPNAGDPVPFVLIGHAGDPREWQCTDMTLDECSHAFVVDRIAWAKGDGLPLTVPDTGGMESGAAVTPRMDLSEVRKAVGAAGDNLVSAAPFLAGDIAVIDPRANLTGDTIVWVVRSLDTPSPAPGASSIPETVTLVDDASGNVIGSQPLKVDPAYQPARLWPTATLHGVECCAGDVYPFLRVHSSDGAVVHEGMVSGSASGGNDITTYGGGYGSTPIVLPAGDYTIDSWLATSSRGVAGAPKDQCSTTITLKPLDDVAPNADFPAGKACTFKAGAPPSDAPSDSPSDAP